MRAIPWPHPLAEVARLAEADGRLPLRLVEHGPGSAVRLKGRVRARRGEPERRLWIMIAAEDGSMLDRWSEADGAEFIRLGEAVAAAGPAAMLAEILRRAGVTDGG
ncbi:hypothetical protein LNKW23_32890 [Paralimibaculum aggregatum]|uniref:Uncharacterized protein n=1 Tax=Paralimibaculum aggregatum TaxID=3036245 RepID=A0ABQ6LLK0_9RHOB|nr:hypothetical protein [Limibaculum sp. NKW23]GMG84075.1 hypothetical protein LNKW23_32890 [Limibaculum sp. NKW23]